MDDLEEIQNKAATIIQQGWRQFYQKQLAADGGSDENDNSPNSDGNEMTEEQLREHLLDKYRTLQADRDALKDANGHHQRSLFKIFADKRGGTHDAADSQSLPADAEGKYWDHIRRLRDERQDIDHQRTSADRALETNKGKYESVMTEAAQYEKNFRDYVRDKSNQASFAGKKQKKIPKVKLDAFEVSEEVLYQQVHEVRVQYIKLRNKSKKLQQDLVDKSKKKEGMHLIDFEQLKIENTNLNEKIEERNEELLKLRKKATTTIHVLTHVKEKLEFVKAENVQLQKQVQQVEEHLTVLRDKLTHTKKDRDVFINDNLKMKEKMPMIGSEDLLLDYELRKKEIENCRIEVVDLTNKHHQLVQWIKSHQGTLEMLQQQTVS